jgi:methionine synthase II (cobalamin-independent)
MAALAVLKGTRIGVLATVPTTLDPTADLIQQRADDVGKQIEIHKHLCEGAFQTLMSGDRDKHDQMVLEGAKVLAPQVDVLVLAQASMARLAPMLSEHIGLEVLSSPRLAVEHVKKMLEEMPVTANVQADS